MLRGVLLSSNCSQGLLPPGWSLVRFKQSFSKGIFYKPCLVLKSSFSFLVAQAMLYRKCSIQNFCKNKCHITWLVTDTNQYGVQEIPWSPENLFASCLQLKSIKLFNIYYQGRDLFGFVNLSK